MRKEKRIVYKYELSMTSDIQTFNLPTGCHIAHFGEQDGKIMMWVDHKLGLDKRLIKLQIIGTGHEIGDYIAIYLATVQMNDGLVWHIYERG